MAGCNPPRILRLKQINNYFFSRGISICAYSGSIRTPILKTSGQAFRNYSDTHSGNIRTVVPETSGH
ncbi:hypothetical protein JCM21142_134745 [Saccharicrinis fermentans DSM 9555 = JCM 21142]|uniref:Uncharacterized protein n=1 Tax=Saccharicrinis fermentans DSM 9555 = JCM 21142 TaxID=869213 RepID=W7Y4W6_9BACT|nr:hypothetical protein JCM21142_134745 [Saccharicrinis fermentans DSM 9555 = JCM 21142]